ncbi:MAG: helicase C-terminal domain-containing protein [Syntrophothermaceae bacterium]
MGENGFYRYSLPDAVLRFKQGMGRLIRSELDWGAAVILDRRLAAPPRGKSYGQMFHRSLPERRVVEISRNEAGREVSGWLNSFT